MVLGACVWMVSLSIFFDPMGFAGVNLIFVLIIIYGELHLGYI